MKRLNNLVIELAAEEDLAAGAELKISNPREGWVYLRAARPDAKLAIDGDGISLRSVCGAEETMRYLPEGEFTVTAAGGASGLVVRAVPELMFCKYQYNPMVPEYGPYDWEFLKRYVLDHVNTVIGGFSDEQVPRIVEWKERSGKWIVEGSLPGEQDEIADVEENVAAWSEGPGMQEPLCDGILLDEFFSGDRAAFPGRTETVRRLAADPRYAGKKVYPYCGSHYPDRDDWGAFDENDATNSSVPFYRAVFESGYRVAWERYMQERHDEDVAQEHIEDKMGRSMRAWRAVYPDAAENMIVVLGYMSVGFALNCHPSVDMKAYYDMQFRYMATAPEFEGLYGITGWTSGYAEAETLKWTARLYRHYGIEGNTEPLCDRFGYTYRLDHIRNPDFAQHWEGWSVPVSIERNCSVKSIGGYSMLQGRWQHTAVGDTSLLLKRSAERPNAVSQPIRKLVPGELYSVKMITADYHDFLGGVSAQKKHAVGFEIEGGEVLPEPTFQSVVGHHPTIKHERFSPENRFYFNHHHVVFRATAETGELTITDWPGSMDRGPVGQEIMVNFVELQPYFSG